MRHTIEDSGAESIPGGRHGVPQRIARWAGGRLSQQLGVENLAHFAWISLKKKE
jgi:hypothetical protein